MSNGKDFVAITRRLRFSGLWRDRRTFSRAEAWIDLLLRAEAVTSDERGELGVVFASLSELGSAWNWSRSTVGRFVAYLDSENMARKIETEKGPAIELVNWAKYQVEVDDRSNSQKIALEHLTPEKPKTYAEPRNTKHIYDLKASADLSKYLTDNGVKCPKVAAGHLSTMKIKDLRGTVTHLCDFFNLGTLIIDLYNNVLRAGFPENGKNEPQKTAFLCLFVLASSKHYGNSEFRTAFAEFVAHRTEIRKPLTVRAALSLIAKFESHTPADSVAAIRSSIEAGYSGIFPKPTKAPIPSRGSNLYVPPPLPPPISREMLEDSIQKFREKFGHNPTDDAPD